MKYCKFCNTFSETDSNGAKCEKCGRKLRYVTDDTPIFIVSAWGFEKERISAALHDNGIPFSTANTRKDLSAEAITGGNSAKVDFFVPYRSYQNALEVLIGISAIKGDELTELNDDGRENNNSGKQSDLQEEYSPGKMRAVRIISIILLLIIITLVVLGTDTVINYLIQAFK